MPVSFHPEVFWTVVHGKTLVTSCFYIDKRREIHEFSISFRINRVGCKNQHRLKLHILKQTEHEMTETNIKLLPFRHLQGYRVEDNDDDDERLLLVCCFPCRQQNRRTTSRNGKKTELATHKSTQKIL